MRGLVHVRAILGGMGVMVVPGDVSVGGAHSAFDDDGSLVDPKLEVRVSKQIAGLVETTDAPGEAACGNLGEYIYYVRVPVTQTAERTQATYPTNCWLGHNTR